MKSGAFAPLFAAADLPLGHKLKITLELRNHIVV